MHTKSPLHRWPTFSFSWNRYVSSAMKGSLVVWKLRLRAYQPFFPDDGYLYIHFCYQNMNSFYVYIVYWARCGSLSVRGWHITYDNVMMMISFIFWVVVAFFPYGWLILLWTYHMSFVVYFLAFCTTWVFVDETKKIIFIFMICFFFVWRLTGCMLIFFLSNLTLNFTSWSYLVFFSIHLEST